MWSRSRDSDRERVARENERKIRDGFPPSERPKGYWLFFAVVVALVVLVVFLLFAFV